MSRRHYSIWCNPISLFLFGLAWLLLIVGAGCRLIPGSPSGQTSVVEGELPAMTCQVDDFSGPGWGLDGAEAAAPRLEAYGEPVVNAYRVWLGEHALAYFSLACELALYENEAAAQRIFQKICEPGRSPRKSSLIGEEVCTFTGGRDEAPHHLIFRRKNVLVLLWGDVGLERPALAVDRRLQSGG